MNSSTRHVVLLGIGHTNAHVVREWGRRPPDNATLTCVSNYDVATYSGMLPAVLAGQKPVEAMQIDLRALCNDVGADLRIGEVIGLDRARRKLQFADGSRVPYDLLSIGIGSVPASGGVDISQHAHAVTIKPMQTFLERLDLAARKRRLGTATSSDNDAPSLLPNAPLRFAIVGAGVAGVEISFCLPGFLQSHGITRSAAITLIDRGEEVARGVSPPARRRIERTLEERGTRTCLSTEVVDVDESRLHFADGTNLEADVVIWATGATAPPLLRKLLLPTDERGFLLTDDTLRVISEDPIFVVGDSGTIKGMNVPKAGVYAVRQGPVLWSNIRRMLDGRRLKCYEPQRSFLRLINTGDGSAIGDWHGFAFAGPWAWWLKNGIDTQFVQKYQRAPSHG